MTDLRTLAQAVVDTPDDDAARYALGDWLDYPRDVRDTVTLEQARAILAALDAERAQGYARAMGEVVERADHSADYTGWSDYALGHRDAHERLAVWARERLPAAAEKEHGG